MVASTTLAQLPNPGDPVDCDCTTLDSNGNVIPDDAGVRKGCAGRGYLVTDDGNLKVSIQIWISV